MTGDMKAAEALSHNEDPLTAAVNRFSETWQEYQKQERERVAAAIEAVSKAVQAVVDVRAAQEWLPMEAKGTDVRFQFSRDGKGIHIRVHPEDAEKTAIVGASKFTTAFPGDSRARWAELVRYHTQGSDIPGCDRASLLRLAAWLDPEGN